MVYHANSVDPTGAALLTRWENETVMNKLVGVSAIATPYQTYKRAVIVFELEGGSTDLIIGKIELSNSFAISSMGLMQTKFSVD